MEYGVAIRSAFTEAKTPAVLMMTPRLKKTHRIIMALPIPQRELLISWHFEDDTGRAREFGRSDREPSGLKAIYQKIGRKM